MRAPVDPLAALTPEQWARIDQWNRGLAAVEVGPDATEPRQLEPYVGAGLAEHLIPLHGWDTVDEKGRERGKSPRDARWRRARYSREEIRRWIERGRNVGFRIPRDMAIIDYDPRNAPEGRDDLIAYFQLEYGIDLSKCPCVETGSGGCHWYVRHPSLERLVNGLPGFPGIEIKGFGRQVVAAGSVHPNGNAYRWRRGVAVRNAPAISPSLRLAARWLGRQAGTTGAAKVISVAEIKACLGQIPVEGYNGEHDRWLQLMMAVHAASGGDVEALDAFIEWSCADPDYADHDEQIRQRWDSLRPDGGITVATLYGHVRQAGGRIPVESAVDAFTDAPPIEDETPAREAPPRAQTINLAIVTPRAAEWHWPPYLPRKMLALCDGDPGVGKTNVAFDVIARTSRGDAMPLCDRETQPGTVLLVACEDALREVVVPRLLAAGADLGRIEVIDGSWRADEIEKLDGIVRRLRPAIVYIDSIMTTMGGSVDTHKDSQTRDRLEPLARLAERHDLLVMASRHFTKQDKDRAIYAGQGSIAFTALARSVLLFGTNPDAPKEERLMAHAKCNVGPLGPSLRYRIVSRTLPDFPVPQPAVEWLGRSERSADDVARWKPTGDKRGGNRLALASFLVEYFAKRESASPEEVRAAAKEELGREFSGSAWQRARGDVGIASTGGGRNTKWIPAGDAAAPPLDADDSLAS